MRPIGLVVIVALVLLIIVIVFAIGCRHKEPQPYVIGENLARARALEEQRKQRGDTGKSPMPDGTYDFWRGETSLINPHKLPLDSTLGALCKEFAARDESERQQSRRSISMDEFYTLLTFSQRAAVFAMREQSTEWVTKGLAALAMIEAERTDFRDILLVLSLLYYSAKRVGANADQLLRQAAVLSEPEVAELLTGFVERPAAEKDLRDAWGNDEVETKDGVGFIGWDFQPYNPTCDLKSLALDIADLIAADKYQPDSVKIATELPSVWLESSAKDAVEKLLQKARGGASIDGRLRPGEYAQADSQILMIFVVELQDEPTAQVLLEMSREKKTTKYAMIGVAEKQLFCLMVGESWRGGVDSFETPEKLSRFSKGIAEILLRHTQKR
jgi:hypothetical protein